MRWSTKHLSAGIVTAMIMTAWLCLCPSRAVYGEESAIGEQYEITGNTQLLRDLKHASQDLSKAREDLALARKELADLTEKHLDVYVYALSNCAQVRFRQWYDEREDLAGHKYDQLAANLETPRHAVRTCLYGGPEEEPGLEVPAEIMARLEQCILPKIESDPNLDKLYIDAKRLRQNHAKNNSAAMNAQLTESRNQGRKQIYSFFASLDPAKCDRVEDIKPAETAAPAKAAVKKSGTPKKGAPVNKSGTAKKSASKKKKK